MQFWAWILSAWKSGSWKDGSWGSEEQPILPVQSGGGGAGGGSWSMWDEPIPLYDKDNYKLLKQEDREMFEILEALTLSGML